MMRRRDSLLKKGFMFGMLLPLLLVVAGCLESEITRHVKHNAENDSFEVLSVFNHIRAQSASDLDHLGHLCGVRSEIIHPIAPISLFTQPAWIRQSNSTYQETNLGEAGALELKKTEIDLDSITVKPGKFFFNKNGMPAYYHRIVVPGKAFDGFLERFDGFVNEVTVNAVRDERRRRAQGHPARTWEETRKTMLTESSEKVDEDQTGDFPFNALSDDSLSRLAQHATASKLNIRREAARFRMTLPLTPEDAGEAAETVEAAKRKILEEAEKEKVAPEAVAVVKSIRAAATDFGSLTVSIDIGPVVSSGPEEPARNATGARYLDNATLVESLKNRGIEFDEALTHVQVVNEFLRNPLSK